MPAFPFSRFAKTLLITAAAGAIGFGAIDHALAQKGGYLENIGSKSPDFFSFELGGRNSALMLASMSTALEVGKVETLALRDSLAMSEFYNARNGQTLWVDPRDDEHPKAEAALAILEQSWTHGLNPQSYHVKEIRNLLGAEDPASKAKLEILVSDAVVRYGHDLTGMRLPPNAIRQDARFWRTSEGAKAVLGRVAQSSDIEDTLESFVPRDEMYHRLRNELIRLATHSDRAYEQYLPISFNDYTLYPGNTHKDVAKLRARLGLKHNPENGSERFYDDALAAAVIKFQREHGLLADGIIGSKTLALLNRSSADDMKQIVANMERLRWLDQNKPGKYLLVNIPSATLWAVEDGQVQFEMPVIVGRPERQTKSFVTEITGVRFNPKWTVPPTIKAQDFLPKLIENPYYLQDKGIEVTALLDGKRVSLDSSLIEWNRVTKKDLADLRMQQAAGDNNALGRIRVLMDNPYDIYLHDTNAPEYFQQPERTLSSGCIRLSEPEKVAEFILEDNEGWSASRMNSIIERGNTTEITAAQTLPVYILYMTMWEDEDGRLVYGPDVYKQDQKLINAMADLKAFHIPEAASL